MRNPILANSVRTFLAICLLLIAYNAVSADTGLSPNQYTDPKGYFKIFPPKGWKLQEYPNDPRGKVAFLAPDGKTDLRVLVNSVDFTTIDDLVAFCRSVEKKIGVETNIERFSFDGRKAVRRTFEYRGTKFLYIDFLIGDVDHNIAYSSPKTKYISYLNTIKQSMDTYEPFVMNLSEREGVEHLVAKKKRLAQLMIDVGNYSKAIEFVDEGLEVQPDNEELLALRAKAKKQAK